MQSQPEVDPRWDDPNSYDEDLPPDWDARRRRVYRRDDWTCQECGRQSGPHANGDGVRLHAHHMSPRSEGGSNALSNLTTLCEPCHDDTHEHDIFGDDWVGEPDRGRSPETSTSTGRAGYAIAAAVGLFAAINLFLITFAIEALTELSTPELVGAFLLTSIVVAGLTIIIPTRIWQANSVALGLYALGVWGSDMQATDPGGIFFLSLAAIPWLFLSAGLFFSKI